MDIFPALNGNRDIRENFFKKISKKCLYFEGCTVVFGNRFESLCSLQALWDYTNSTPPAFMGKIFSSNTFQVHLDGPFFFIRGKWKAQTPKTKTWLFFRVFFSTLPSLFTPFPPPIIKHNI